MSQFNYEPLGSFTHNNWGCVKRLDRCPKSNNPQIKKYTKPNNMLYPKALSNCGSDGVNNINNDPCPVGHCVNDGNNCTIFNDGYYQGGNIRCWLGYDGNKTSQYPYLFNNVGANYWTRRIDPSIHNPSPCGASGCVPNCASGNPFYGPHQGVCPLDPSWPVVEQDTKIYYILPTSGSIKCPPKACGS